MQPHGRSIVAVIVATDPRLVSSATQSDQDRGCVPATERARIRERAKAYRQLATTAATSISRQAYGHLARACESLAAEDGLALVPQRTFARDR